jgi:2,3-dihydroxy-2,3-dihydro-p-cumate dehydrogenase
VGLRSLMVNSSRTLSVGLASCQERPSGEHAYLAAGRAPGRFGRVLADAIALIPAGRPAEADEVAAAVSFLAREDSGFITGQILSVNGGSSMS